MRNYLLSKKIGGPLLAGLNIFRDPLLVSVKFETPPTHLIATNQYTMQKSEERAKQIKAKTEKLIQRAKKRRKNARQTKPLESQLSH